MGFSYSAVNEYKKDSSVKTYDGEINRKYKNGEYLTATDLLYFEKKVQLSVFESLDSMLETVFTDAGYTFDSAATPRAEETKITLTLDLSWTNRNNSLNIETVEKSLEAYKAQKDSVSLDYVYDDMTDERLAAAVKALNDRISNDKTEITAEAYVEAQNEAVRQFKKNIASYYADTAAYFKASVESVVRQQLYIDYQTNKYSGIEKESDFRTRLDQKLENLRAQDKEKYALNPKSFETFVTGLSDTSFIYYIPEQYVGKYGFLSRSATRSPRFSRVTLRLSERAATFILPRERSLPGKSGLPISSTLPTRRTRTRLLRALRPTVIRSTVLPSSRISSAE